MTESTPIAPEVRFPFAEALAVAKVLAAELKPLCSRLLICGSLRRRRPDVGDIELVYIPRTEERPGPPDLFGFRKEMRVNLVDERLDSLLTTSVLSRRLNIQDHATWGARIKLAVHVASGIPVDLFASTEAGWWSYVVCRTGPKTSNIRICNAALAKGWTWHPFEGHFTDSFQCNVPITCEKDAFYLVGLPYDEPKERR